MGSNVRIAWWSQPIVGWHRSQENTSPTIAASPEAVRIHVSRGLRGGTVHRNLAVARRVHPRTVASTPTRGCVHTMCTTYIRAVRVQVSHGCTSYRFVRAGAELRWCAGVASLDRQGAVSSDVAGGVYEGGLAGLACEKVYKTVR